ncbi:hypothetical protein M422DRAFT_250456 [Sphaerobolus stellatus SS14]|uniref:Unplaced genomic scaffold SPHSTscaffold_34, whole genome shotgun sequence n=1 Tax=Sphaerobolus stellatus (strain SS14) TaxID=990650 RepID=A0A0C9UT55_SPHS4|nr:hypothetical protein M422DRAFT_250456 [Sphaerobolus stellatus SS14]
MPQDSVDHATGHATCRTCRTTQELFCLVTLLALACPAISHYLILIFQRRDTLLVTHGPPSMQGSKERYAVATGCARSASSSARRWGDGELAAMLVLAKGEDGWGVEGGG